MADETQPRSPYRPGFSQAPMVLAGRLPGVVGAELRLAGQPQREDDPALAIAGVLRGLAERLMARNTGVALTIDEAQLADRDEMTRFAAALQEGTGRDWPLVVVLAGLRSLRDHRRMPSYFERAEWHELGSLDQAATLEALTEPAAAAGRPFEPAAAAELAGETGGYPYAIQLYGHHAWRASAGQDRITLDAARQAAKTGGRRPARAWPVRATVGAGVPTRAAVPAGARLPAR